MGMSGMGNGSPLRARAEREYRDITTYHSHHPEVDQNDPASVAVATGIGTARSAVGYLLMELLRDNDSIRVQNIVDRAARGVGITKITAHGWTAKEQRT